MTKTFVSALLLAGLLATPALAHHPLGGEVPQTVLHGLLSGIGHPIIGFDHLAFILGIGFLAAFQGDRLLHLPGGLVVGTVIGALLMFDGGITLPAVEVVIILSVLLVGLSAAYGPDWSRRPAPLAATIAGLFHGWAYGEAVIGAEATPILAYLIGFGATQMAIATGVALAARYLIKTGRSTAMVPRLGGAVVAGVGLTYLVEMAEGMVFPGI